MKAEKTNVMRILEREGIPYASHCYEVAGGMVDGLHTARALGRNPACVYKTLVAMGSSGRPCVFVIPVEGELDLKAAARAAGEKSVSMLPLKELLPTTGYIRGGCSPIGMKRPYRTVLDASCLALPSMLVSAGKIGAQVELSPEALMRLVKASTAPLCRQEEG